MKNNIRKLLIIIDICLLLVLGCLLVFYYQLEIPLSRDAEEEVFIIEEGQGLEEIAQNLKAEKVIRSKSTFVFYVWLQGKADNLQAGEYSLSSSINASEVAKKIIKGEVIQDWIKITIPEGWTSNQIEERLIESGLFNPEEHLFYRITTESFPFLVDRPSGVTLQGYLFPDTYYFDKESTNEEIVKRMLSNFGEKLTSDLRKEIERQGKTIFEVIILASIVQNEVNSIKDMSRVAGIFYNRIKIGMPLQSDATVNYVTGKKLRQPLIEDTKIESPYNTYLHLGLPPRPISNPGIEAIRAAIYPEDTDYMYFLNPLDGPTIFSKTFDEHNRNKAKYLR